MQRLAMKPGGVMGYWNASGAQAGMRGLLSTIGWLPVRSVMSYQWMLIMVRALATSYIAFRHPANAARAARFQLAIMCMGPTICAQAGRG